MKNTNTKKMIFMSLAVVINIICGFVALSLKLPVYLDAIGTIFTAIIFGSVSGAIVGGLTSVVNGITFDPISIYFLPVQVIIGISTGLLMRKQNKKISKLIYSIIIVTLLGSITAAIIVSFVFGGVTSSGSSIIVAILKNSGMSIVTSVFSTQIFTDLLDKILSFFVAFIMVKTYRKQYNI